MSLSVSVPASGRAHAQPWLGPLPGGAGRSRGSQSQEARLGHVLVMGFACHPPSPSLDLAQWLQGALSSRVTSGGLREVTPGALNLSHGPGLLSPMISRSLECAAASRVEARGLDGTCSPLWNYLSFTGRSSCSRCGQRADTLGMAPRRQPLLPVLGCWLCVL